jgi:hypothetical protein
MAIGFVGMRCKDYDEGFFFIFDYSDGAVREIDLFFKPSQSHCRHDREGYPGWADYEDTGAERTALLCFRLKPSFGCAWIGEITRLCSGEFWIVTQTQSVIVV